MEKSILEKFNSTFNAEELAKETNEVANKSVEKGEYKEVPFGNYEVALEKLELGETKETHKPKITIWFKILAGEFKNSYIFMNQVITNAFQVHIANEFLKSLESGLDVEFKNYSQYETLLLDILQAVNGNIEYALKYGEDKKGYKTYKITEVFDV